MLRMKCPTICKTAFALLLLFGSATAYPTDAEVCHLMVVGKDGAANKYLVPRKDIIRDDRTWRAVEVKGTLSSDYIYRNWDTVWSNADKINEFDRLRYGWFNAAPDCPADGSVLLPRVGKPTKIYHVPPHVRGICKPTPGDITGPESTHAIPDIENMRDCLVAAVAYDVKTEAIVHNADTKECRAIKGGVPRTAEPSSPTSWCVFTAIPIPESYGRGSEDVPLQKQDTFAKCVEAGYAHAGVQGVSFVTAGGEHQGLCVGHKGMAYVQVTGNDPTTHLPVANWQAAFLPATQSVPVPTTTPKPTTTAGPPKPTTTAVPTTKPKPTPTTTAGPVPKPPTPSKNNTGVILGAVIGVAGGLLLVVVIAVASAKYYGGSEASPVGEDAVVVEDGKDGIDIEEQAEAEKDVYVEQDAAAWRTS